MTICWKACRARQKSQRRIHRCQVYGILGKRPSPALMPNQPDDQVANTSGGAAYQTHCCSLVGGYRETWSFFEIKDSWCRISSQSNGLPKGLQHCCRRFSSLK